MKHLFMSLFLGALPTIVVMVQGFLEAQLNPPKKTAIKKADKQYDDEELEAEDLEDDEELEAEQEAEQEADAEKKTRRSKK